MLLNDALNQSSATNRSAQKPESLFVTAWKINDPRLPELVRSVDAGESIIDNPYVNSSEEKIETLTELIYQAGNEPSAALLVLLATLENSTQPKALCELGEAFGLHSLR